MFASLPGEILSRILGDYAGGVSSLNMWKSGDMQLRQKMSQCMTVLRLVNHYSTSLCVFPMCALEWYNLRHLSIDRGMDIRDDEERNHYGDFDYEEAEEMEDDEEYNSESEESIEKEVASEESLTSSSSDEASDPVEYVTAFGGRLTEYNTLHFNGENLQDIIKRLPRSLESIAFKFEQASDVFQSPTKLNVAEHWPHLKKLYLIGDSVLVLDDDINLPDTLATLKLGYMKCQGDFVYPPHLTMLCQYFDAEQYDAADVRRLPGCLKTYVDYSRLKRFTSEDMLQLPSTITSLGMVIQMEEDLLRALPPSITLIDSFIIPETMKDLKHMEKMLRLLPRTLTQFDYCVEWCHKLIFNDVCISALPRTLKEIRIDIANWSDVRSFAFPPDLTYLAIKAYGGTFNADIASLLPKELTSFVHQDEVDQQMSADIINHLPRSLTLLNIDVHYDDDCKVIYPPKLMRLSNQRADAFLWTPKDLPPTLTSIEMPNATLQLNGISSLPPSLTSLEVAEYEVSSDASSNVKFPSGMKYLTSLFYIQI